MQPNTHLALSDELCGKPLTLEPGHARVELTTTSNMRADEHGLVHGGFVFGLADYAAMLAINEPNVVLGSAEVRLLAPVRAGETLLASAKLARIEGKKQIVEVEVVRADSSSAVFTGTFVCFVPAAHVLAAKVGERA